MRIDAMARLSAANPVSGVPAMEPAERLRCLIESEGQPNGCGERRAGPARMGRRLLAGVLAVVLASVIGLLLADGSSGPGVNVAAAAYAATSADGGVVEAQFVEHLFSRGRITATLHSREWIDTSTGRRRSQRFLPHAVLRHGQPVAFEIATTPGWTELWNGSEEGPEVIRRFRARPLANKNLAGGAVQPPASESPAEVQLERRQTIEGVTLYRQLYQEGSVKLVGRERLHGRLLWKLEGYTGFAFHSLGAHAKAQPIIAAVVLVDPQTYLPVIERQINLLAPGHPVQVESELLTYRRLPAGAASEALLSLSKQHPGARVLTSAPARPGSRP